MLHTQTSTAYRHGSAAIDAILADSFPASDPPSWNTGVARPDPVVSPFVADVGLVAAGPAVSRAAGRVVDASATMPSAAMPSDRPFAQRLVSLAGAAGIALLVPLVILLVGLPVVLAVRGLLEVVGWLFGVALE